MEHLGAMLDFSGFMPHGMCFLWRPDLLLLHVGSDALIAGAYFSIPSAMLVLLKRRPDMPRGIFLLFVSFIMLCGITHLATIMVVWYPAYYLEGALKLITAIVSVATAVILWPLIPKAAAMPSREDLEKRNAEIEALNRKLQHRIDSLSTLAGGVSHEFNNLLTIISGNTQLMQQENGNNNNTRKLEAISSATTRATEVCSKMLAYSGHGHFMLSEINLNDAIRGAPVSDAADRLLNYNLSLQLGYVHAAQNQIHQLVRYITDNALEAIEETGRRYGRIAISTYEAELGEEDLRRAAFEHNMRPGPVVMLEISDNGSGMRAETMERIFEPYFTTRFTGRGLGMSAVQGIVRGHEACLFIESKEGAGTTISVAFPRVFHVSKRFKTPRVENPRVFLVVDDEQDILQLAQKYLLNLGKKVYATSNCREAIKLVEQYKDCLDTVILDYLMPDMFGNELMQEIAAIVDVDVYMTSGYTRGEFATPAVREQLIGFVAKPFNYRDFEKLFGK